MVQMVVLAVELVGKPALVQRPEEQGRMDRAMLVEIVPIYMIVPVAEGREKLVRLLQVPQLEDTAGLVLTVV